MSAQTIQKVNDVTLWDALNFCFVESWHLCLLLWCLIFAGLHNHSPLLTMDSISNSVTEWTNKQTNEWTYKHTFLSQSPFPIETWNKIPSSIFCNKWMWGYQALCLQDGRQRTQKEITLNMCLKQHVKVALVIEVVRNLFQTFHSHVDSLIWFRYWMIVCV